MLYFVNRGLQKPQVCSYPSVMGHLRSTPDGIQYQMNGMESLVVIILCLTAAPRNAKRRSA